MEIERAFRPQRLGNSTTWLKNLFIRSAAYEGMTPSGIPSPALTEHHAAMARGGVAMTTVSYGAVSESGRTFGEQLCLNPGNFERLAVLAERVHQAGGKVSLQLTHCGYFSKQRKQGAPVAPSRTFNAYGVLSGIPWSREMDQEDMDAVGEDFARSAVSAKKAGFDAVEIHMGHGYLLSQFLSPVTNRRKDAYGGGLENRARFPLEVVNRVLHRTGKDFPVLVKLNLSDGLRGGFSLDDCRIVSGMLESAGCSAIVLSGGFTSRTPFYLLRGKVPLWGMARNGSSIAEKATMAIFGPLIIRKYRFEENFFLRQAMEIRKSVNMQLVYLGGVESREGIRQILDAGFDFIAIARALIHDPDFLIKLEDGRIHRSECTRCNRCVVEMDRDGLKCVI